jgi:UrcA family protein
MTMNTKSRLALLAAAMIATTAMAQPSRSLWDDAQTRTETVKFKVSEATTVEGATALYSKLQEAAVRVCVDQASINDDAVALRSCAADALTTAVERLAIPMVSVMHLQAGRSAIVSR